MGPSLHSLGFTGSKDIKSNLNPASVPFVPGTIGTNKVGDGGGTVIHSNGSVGLSSADKFLNSSEIGTAVAISAMPALTSPSCGKKSAPSSSTSGSSGCQPDFDDLKSPISLVHESALKRNLTVHFDIVRETGPPHMRIFITKCIMGEFVTKGEGNGKKVRKATLILKASIKIIIIRQDEDGYYFSINIL